MKRVLDVVIAGVGLVVASPVMVVLALAVALTSPGGALFRQVRVGREGEEFEILKFRSMRLGEPGIEVTAGGDPRITLVGAVLRSTKLDELPQLINVLRGEMSLVGPRPEVPKYVAHWPADIRREVLSVRPGITDPASLTFRREEEILAEADDPERAYLEEVMPQKLALYVDYVRNQTITGDLGILLGTVKATVGG
ncbi:glycosyl transferase [Nocardioides phosphati]|uniref:Glycosyl transferase n=1 Tax=Nocardioides phosphati TaxID=1867775 RepID=A0ABQ2NCA8_9ACTN|nr:sugar transferase [Nocardioides phosphati]GGO92527.1 glycosyl transferase [Nocardioides phosphati]